jgi:raffinose/stachyose/melibiose transport system substrate-binding protein
MMGSRKFIWIRGTKNKNKLEVVLMLYKNIFVPFISTMLILTLAACSSNGAVQSTKGSEQKDEKKNTEKITLTLMHNWTSPNPDNDIYKKRVADFEAKFPNIKIEQEVVPFEQYFTKVRTQATGKNLSDLTVVWPGIMLKPFVDSDMFMPINEIMDSFKGYLPNENVSEYNFNGKQYAVPTKMNYTDIIYYDKKKLAEVGFNNFPTTYTEFLDLVQKLNGKGYTPFTLGNKDRWPLQSVLFSIVADRVTGSDFLPKVMTGERKFTEPEFVQALSIIDELTKKNAFNKDLNTLDATQSTNYIIQGKTAMFMMTSNVNSIARAQNPNGNNIGIALFPQVENGKGDPKKSSGAQNTGIAIKSDIDPKKKDAAMTFLKFFYSEQLYKDLVKVGILIPAKIEFGDDTDKYIKEIIQLNSTGTTQVYDSVIPAEVKDVLENGLQAITMGAKTPEKVAAEVQASLETTRKK